MSEASGQVEKVFYDGDGVRVTNARFQVGAQTYAMNAVTSVSYQQEQPSLVGSTILLTFGALFVLLGGVSLLGTLTRTGPWLTLAIGVLLVGFGIHLRRAGAGNFIVALTTSSGQVQALKSMDRTHIEKVVTALNEALVSRG